jgi:ubiquinone/menaquinone biosynthesis C-methylase UbiE
MPSERVSFGFRPVTPEEKRRLVREQFDRIARTYDLADTVLSAGVATLYIAAKPGVSGEEDGAFKDETRWPRS